MPLRVLCLGDIVGRPGRQVVCQKLPSLVRERQIDLVIANAENIAGGSGITQNLFNKVRSYGVDVVTLGDHIYKKQDIIPTLQNSERIVRPANLSAHSVGRTSTCITTNSGISVCVFSLMGRIYMNLPADDPFAAADRLLAQMPSNVRVCVCDFHAEATSEKVAMGHWLDGRVSVIFGTHTHIPTADARILKSGTALMADAGMCGDYDSVIGVEVEEPLGRFLTGISNGRFTPAEGEATLCGVAIETDPKTGLTVNLSPVRIGGTLSQSLPTF
jgi:metallophosphoesterase (TIGR00282 family)